jgi:uncharacterized protein (DUF486 family)
MRRALTVIGLLTLSNTFMNFAWYGHLRFKAAPILITILVSWMIALPEYALQVPANRFGHGQFTAPQLKVIQEAISVSVFVAISVLYLNETPTWRTGLALVLILAAVALALSGPATDGVGVPASAGLADKAG